MQRERQDSLGQAGYWQSFGEEDDTFYGHVLGCKGLERRAVVLCINESEPREAPGRACMSGCPARPTASSSSATPAVVAAMAGEEVAARLGL